MCLSGLTYEQIESLGGKHFGTKLETKNRLLPLLSNGNELDRWLSFWVENYWEGAKSALFCWEEAAGFMPNSREHNQVIPAWQEVEDILTPSKCCHDLGEGLSK